MPTLSLRPGRLRAGSLLGGVNTMTLQFDMRHAFFDRQAVKRAVDKSARRPLNRIGGMVRMTARRSIRPARRKKLAEYNRYQLSEYRWRQRIGLKPRKLYQASDPGDPPRSRTGVLRRNIYYAYDSYRQSVVVGPARLSRVRHLDNSPEILEKGGVATIKCGPKRRTVKRVRIERRPYMKPALTKNLPKINGMLRDFVRPYG